MNTTVCLYEMAVVVVGAVAWGAVRPRYVASASGGGEWLRAARGQITAELAIVMGILGVLGVAGLIALALWLAAGTTRVCLGNIRDIETAAIGYNVATGTYPATSAAITTATFAPISGGVSFLKQAPIDPVNTTGKYTWTFTAGSTTVADDYVITCPGAHNKATLIFIDSTPGAAGKIQYDSSSGVTTI